MQYRSSTELANQFKIKREQLDNERNDKAKKEHVPIAHKRKNSEDLILQTKKRLFQSGESIQEKRIKLPMQNFRFQMSSKQGVTDSVYVTGETFGNSEVQHGIQDQLNFKQVKRKSVIPATSLDKFLAEQRLQKEHDINDLPNCKQVKRKSIIPATSLEQFPKKQSIHIGDETKTNNHTVADDLVDQEEINRDECAIDEEIGIDCSKEGTISRNPRFINLMYTSWHAVPEDTKKRMWEYTNSKFIIPLEGKAWVMTGFRDAWKRYKQKIKERFFDKNSTIEDMLAKRPSDIAEDEFRQLIEYWKDPTVQAMCEINSQNRKKQKWRHRMGPISFARVHVALAELQNCQNFGETADDVFTAVFGKEQPGRLRCYGRSVTASSLKKDEEDSKQKQKHANEITSRKEEMNEMREEIREEMKEEMRHFFSQLLQNNPGLNVRGMQWGVVSNIASPIDAGSAQAVKGQNLLQSSGSTHDPILQKNITTCYRSVLACKLNIHVITITAAAISNSGTSQDQNLSQKQMTLDDFNIPENFDRKVTLC
ncbi:uncharacterized protein LOC107030871 [Solanum pennellii]|uniref:Uncharacterized protein LOC107030871 n=1 Tax=Solanum pennellii TaxID=28526 RepID=A0ABM1UWB7_SOLPN|nr:uncharacterized protein LOC107030871 [Solanum pennellii]